MAKRRGSLASISAEEAQKALAYLVHEGTVTAKAVQKALQRREKLVREIRERMVALGVESLAISAKIGKGAITELRRAEKSSRKPRRKAVSAATKSARQFQGQYMSAIRRLSKTARKEIKALRAKSGVKAAIAAAKGMAK
ncbi:MAG: hypothetical protein M3167_02580 [Acidobacteriota bacterium]|nr:hypothetical protein [Acidobacteriota bacterium]